MPLPTVPSSTDQQTDPVDLLRSLIAIPSLSGEEGPAADLIEHVGRSAGVDVWRKDDNVVLSVGEGENVLLLNSHLDVVPPSDGHHYAPFDPVVKDGWLFGRGSVDAKASGAAMMSALLEAASSGSMPANGQLMVALTACEEGGGMYNGLQDIRPDVPEPAAVVIGEPTGLIPCVAQKGLLILKIHAHGTSAHAGRPHLGVNAITRAATAVQEIEQLILEKEDPHLGAPTVTVTTIEGGSARNAVPEHCVFAVDIRTTPAYTHTEIIDRVRSALQPYDGVEVEVYSNRFVPCATPENAPIRQVAIDASSALHGEAVVPFGSPTASDWIFVQDLPAVKLGPGDSNRSHTADERIRVSDVHSAQRLYLNLARTYFERTAA
ncbi:peptidase M20 [Longibacter salinarum]|uniref:Peptidase M20 n=1 Tax=Longibacter salinarum TaxID=1850348 RepID=A0A2A8D0L2_9BACT|nr:M20/M25/M40 family metallo-hydrolase [Longibacter salinarum]PEN14420.1 peptidase M20 [Longibacter salinarum]